MRRDRSFVVKTFHEAATRRGAMVQRSEHGAPVHQPTAFPLANYPPDQTGPVSTIIAMEDEAETGYTDPVFRGKGSPVQRPRYMQLDASSCNAIELLLLTVDRGHVTLLPRFSFYSFFVFFKYLLACFSNRFIFMKQRLTQYFE